MAAGDAVARCGRRARPRRRYPADLGRQLRHRLSRGSGAGWLILSSDVAYAELVDQPSLSFPALMLVVGGDPDSSYLLNKLDNTQSDVGGGTSPMPLPPASLLPQADIDGSDGSLSRRNANQAEARPLFSRVAALHAVLAPRAMLLHAS